VVTIARKRRETRCDRRGPSRLGLLLGASQPYSTHAKRQANHPSATAGPMIVNALPNSTDFGAVFARKNIFLSTGRKGSRRRLIASDTSTPYPELKSYTKGEIFGSSSLVQQAHPGKGNRSATGQSLKPSQKYLKFSGQRIWLSLSDRVAEDGGDGRPVPLMLRTRKPVLRCRSLPFQPMAIRTGIVCLRFGSFALSPSRDHPVAR